MYRRVILAGLCLHAASAAGQPFRPPPGRYPIEEHLSEPIVSLEQLIRMSDLIVDGVVLVTQASQLASPPDPRSIRTPFVFQTDAILWNANAKQKPLEAGAKLTIVEPAGTIEGCERYVPNDPMFQPGERYVLFLRPIPERRLLAGRPGPSYEVSGITAGKVLVADGKIQFRAGANPWLKAHDGTGVRGFLQLVKDKAEGKFTGTVRKPD